MKASWIFALALLPAGICPSAQAAGVSTATVRLALIEPDAVHGAARLDTALERLLRLSSNTVRLVDIQSVPCYHSGSDYRLRLPAREGADEQAVFSTMTAVSLEADSESALIFPPVPELIEKLQSLAEDPKTFRTPWIVRTASKTLTVTEVRGPNDETLVTAQLDPTAGEGAQWLSAEAESYQLEWQGREVSVVIMAKIYGGMGRLATLLERERKKGPLLGIARSDSFGTAEGGLKGKALADKLEKLGLSYAAIGSAEVRRWKEVQDYRKERPDGIQFLSANLVYTSSPTVTLLADHAVVPIDGLKVCLVGMTPPESAKYMGQGGLAGATVADPVQAFQAKSAQYRKECGLVVLLGALTPEASRLRYEALGADIIVAEDYKSPYHASERADERAHQSQMNDFDEPMWAMKYWYESFNVLDISLRMENGRRSIDLDERHLPLDESVPWALGFPPFIPEDYTTILSTEPPLLPAARRIFTGPLGEEGFPQIDGRRFWTMAAGLLADKTGSEIGLLRVSDLPIQQDTEIPESVVKAWLFDEDQAVILYLRGSELKPLLAEAHTQADRAAKGLPRLDKIGYAAGGVETDDKIHGIPIDDQQTYRVTTTMVLADALGLSADHPPKLLARTADDIILEALHQRVGSPPADYRHWMEGQPVSRRGIWKINFRDVGLNLQDTQNVHTDAFDSVPNSRIQGFSQYTVGGDFKTDADYLYDPYKWSNTVELEYAQSRLSPRNLPPVVNTPANRIMALTMVTRREGAIPEKWLAQSWGPSLGFQYDSEFQATPGLPRKQIYSAFPGIELYDGTFVKKWEITANVRRDEGRIPPDNQGGLHTRMLFSKDFGKAPVNFQGEMYANYFFLTHQDTNADLRFEGDINFKLKVPINKYLTVAPFMDFYVYELKIQPLAGYSAMTGISIAFSRLWKPQYERF